MEVANNKCAARGKCSVCSVLKNGTVGPFEPPFLNVGGGDPLGALHFFMGGVKVTINSIQSHPVASSRTKRYEIRVLLYMVFDSTAS